MMDGRVLVRKVVVATFNQEKALVGAFSVVVQLHRHIHRGISITVSFLATDLAQSQASTWWRARVARLL